MTKTTKSGHLDGYARVSTTDEDLAIQEQALRAAGYTVIRSETKTGTTTKGATPFRG